MTLWSEWWVWAIAAVGLATFETVIPGYAFLGLALGAVVIAIGLPMAEALGFGEPTFSVLMIAYSVIALGLWFLLRYLLKPPGGKAKVYKGDINND
ncbi:MAG: hypothetical protein AAFY99_15180 [Pseudomonadota bacterium]